MISFASSYASVQVLRTTADQSSKRPSNRWMHASAGLWSPNPTALHTSSVTLGDPIRVKCVEGSPAPFGNCHWLSSAWTLVPFPAKRINELSGLNTVSRSRSASPSPRSEGRLGANRLLNLNTCPQWNTPTVAWRQWHRLSSSFD